MRAAGVKLGSAGRGWAEPTCALRDQVGALSAPDGVPAGLRKRRQRSGPSRTISAPSLQAQLSGAGDQLSGNGSSGTRISMPTVIPARRCPPGAAGRPDRPPCTERPRHRGRPGAAPPPASAFVASTSQGGRRGAAPPALGAADRACGIAPARRRRAGRTRWGSSTPPARHRRAGRFGAPPPEFRQDAERVVPRLAEAGMTAPVMRERDGELGG